MKDWWSTRWYTPLVALGVAALVLAVVALAIVEVLVAAGPTGPTGSSAPFAPQNRLTVADALGITERQGHGVAPGRAGAGQSISSTREAGYRPFPGGQSR